MGKREQTTGNRQLRMGNSAAFRSIPYFQLPITNYQLPKKENWKQIT